MKIATSRFERDGGSKNRWMQRRWGARARGTYGRAGARGEALAVEDPGGEVAGAEEARHHRRRGRIAEGVRRRRRTDRRAGGWGSRAALLDWGIAGVGRGGDLWSVVVNFRTRPAEVRVRWESGDDGEWGWGSCDVRTVRGHDSPRASLVGFT
jgi:hypothetical protein